MNKYIPIAKVLNHVIPSFKLAPYPAKGKAKKHIMEFMKDPLVESNRIAIRNILLNTESLKKFHESEMDKVMMPFIMILGGQDAIVSN